jgi:hypothetical protein
MTVQYTDKNHGAQARTLAIEVIDFSEGEETQANGNELKIVSFTAETRVRSPLGAPRKKQQLRWNCPPALDSTASECFDTDAEAIFGAKATPMLRVTALLSVAIAMQTAAIAEDAKPDTVEVHGKALQLSCAEWKRNQDGSWTSIGALLVGTDTLKNVTLRDGKETKVLDAKCQNPSSPSATPSQSGDTTRHTGHKHHPADPAQGT